MQHNLTAINDIKDIILNDDGTYTILYNEYESKSGARLVTADWEEVPHYNKKGELITPEEYAQQTIAKYGKQYHAQTNLCVGGDTVINTIEYNDITIEELYEMGELYE